MSHKYQPVLNAFLSTAEYAVQNPDRTKKGQYNDLHGVALFLEQQGLLADAQSPCGTPAYTLMAQLAEKHPPFKEIVLRYDSAQAGKPRAQIAAATTTQQAISSVTAAQDR